MKINMLETTNLRKKTAFLSFLLFFILLTSSYIFILNFSQSNHWKPYSITDFNNIETQKEPMTAAQESLTTVWFKNPTLDTPIEPEWYSGVEGDLTDSRAKGSSDQANFIVIAYEKNIKTPKNCNKKDSSCPGCEFS